MKICLIGSSRFADKYREVNRRLSLAGHVVYSIATTSTSASGFEPLEPHEKETLDLVHLKKITESDECFVITDQTGYVGESTRREIKWASMNGVEVYAGDHYLNHHLCGNGDLQHNVQSYLEYIKKASEAGDGGSCENVIRGQAAGNELLPLSAILLNIPRRGKAAAAEDGAN